MPELRAGGLKIGPSLPNCGPCGIELNNLYGVPALSRPANGRVRSSGTDDCTLRLRLRLRLHRFIRKLVTECKRSLLIGQRFPQETSREIVRIDRQCRIDFLQREPDIAGFTRREGG